MGQRSDREVNYGGACLCCRHLMGDDTAVSKLTGFEFVALVVASAGVIGGFVALYVLAGSI